MRLETVAQVLKVPVKESRYHVVWLTWREKYYTSLNCPTQMPTSPCADPTLCQSSYKSKSWCFTSTNPLLPICCIYPCPSCSECWWLPAHRCCPPPENCPELVEATSPRRDMRHLTKALSLNWAFTRLLWILCSTSWTLGLPVCLCRIQFKQESGLGRLAKILQPWYLTTPSIWWHFSSPTLDIILSPWPPCSKNSVESV